MRRTVIGRAVCTHGWRLLVRARGLLCAAKNPKHVSRGLAGNSLPELRRAIACGLKFYTLPPLLGQVLGTVRKKQNLAKTHRHRDAVPQACTPHKYSSLDRRGALLEQKKGHVKSVTL